MSETKTEKKETANLTAELYLAIDNLAFAVATEDSDCVKNSEVYKSAMEVLKIVKKMRNVKTK